MKICNDNFIVAVYSCKMRTCNAEKEEKKNCNTIKIKNMVN